MRGNWLALYIARDASQKFFLLIFTSPTPPRKYEGKLVSVSGKVGEDYQEASGLPCFNRGEGLG
jgi:hypothetical protein